ncbi:MAG: MipA/OmpV family protein [Cognaticolwellia sp.]
MQKLSSKFFLKYLWLIAVLTLALPAQVQAATTLPKIAKNTVKPRWEAGALFAAFHGPLYPAAAENQSKLLPVPFLVYRGEKFRIGEDGVVKAIAVDKPRFKVDLSLGAAFSVNSDDAKAREGMPDLDFIFELGPEVSFMLTNSKTSETWLNLQLRKVLSTDFSSVVDRGVIFQPELAYQGEQLFGTNDRFKLIVSPLFTTKKTQQYFYQVDNEFSTATRPYYQAKGGYLGTEVALVNRFQVRDDLSIFISTKLGFYKGARNDDSPLFKKDFNYTLGLGVKWTLFESHKASLF